MKKSITYRPSRILPISIVAVLLFANSFSFAQGALWGPVGTTGVTTSRQVFIKNSAVVDSSLTANLLITNGLRSLGLAQIDALLVNGSSTFSGNISLSSGVSIIHAVSNGTFSFSNSAGDNIIGLGYNLNDPATQQGLLIAPAGFKGNANGSIVLGDANANGQILLALGTGNTGSRINVDGAGKRVVFQNDGGDKYTMGGVNAPTTLETTQGINVAPRSGFTFSGTHLLNAQGSINAENYYLNGNLIDVPKIGSDIAALQTAVDSLKQNPGSQWQTNGNDIYYQDENATNPGNVGIGISNPPERLSVNGNIASSGTVFASGGLFTTGNIQGTSITTGNLTITDKISSKTAEADTMHAIKSLEVNNSIRLSRDTSEMYAEVATKDTAVALMLQKEPSAPVVIGDAPAPPPGESRDKLTVIGNSGFTGNVRISGSLTAPVIGNEGTTINAATITANTFNAVQFSSDKIIANNITSTDSVLWIGDSTLGFMGNANRIIGSSTGSTYRGLGLGVNTIAGGVRSSAIGKNVRAVAGAENSVVIGSGMGFTETTLFNNDIPNSLMVGFNTSGNVPTLFVGPADGTPFSIGSVGIGISNPIQALDLNGKMNVRGGVIQKGETAITGTNDLGLYSLDKNGGIRLVTTAQPIRFFSDGGAGTTANVTIESNGNVIIGTLRPTGIHANPKLSVDGKVVAKEFYVTKPQFWADYILKKDYPLLPVAELEAFIDTAGHLPDMPSEKELLKNGYSLSDMAKMQQAEIEKLVKYVIMQNRRIDALEAEITVLKKKQ